nr:hypothetical protein [Gammaproteobacteria bacterium]
MSASIDDSQRRYRFLPVRFIACMLVAMIPLSSARAQQEAPSDLTGNMEDQLAVIQWQAAENAAGYNVYRDNSYVTTVTDTVYAEPLANGQVATFYVVAFSAPPAEYSVPSVTVTLPASAVPDDLTVPPSVPTNLTGSIEGTLVRLSWTESTDDEAVSGYNVYQNNEYTATVFGTSWEGTVNADQKYTYNIVAFDIRNNFSAQSPSLLLPQSASTGEPTPPSVP